jgi:hypothetical protein
MALLALFWPGVNSLRELGINHLRRLIGGRASGGTITSANVSEVTVDFADGCSTATATVTVAGVASELWIRVPGDLRGDPRVNDAFAALTLFPAMRSASSLTMSAPVSPQLLDGLEKIQDIFIDWYPEYLSRVQVVAEPRTVPPEPTQGIASCFTGGVDSFFSLKEHESEISHLFYVDGYDVPIYNVEVLEAVHSHLRDVGAAVGKKEAIAQTNVKRFLLDHGQWGPLMHGVAIASVAMLMSLGKFNRLIIPSEVPYHQLRPWGTHPRVDSLWSTEYLSIAHDDASHNRMEKIAAIIPNPLVREHLHVCLRSDTNYNCSRCYKCIRTMVTFETYGLLDQVQTFTGPLDLNLVRSLPPRNREELHYAEWNLELAEAAQMKELAAALHEAISTAA